MSFLRASSFPAATAQSSEIRGGQTAEAGDEVWHNTHLYANALTIIQAGQNLRGDRVHLHLLPLSEDRAEPPGDPGLPARAAARGAAPLPPPPHHQLQRQLPRLLPRQRQGAVQVTKAWPLFLNKWSPVLHQPGYNLL